MSQSDIRAGRAYVELALRDSEFVRGLSRAHQRLRDFGASATAIGSNMVKLAVLFSLPFLGAIKAASTLEETMNKFNVVFAGNAAAVKVWGDEFAAQVGRSKRQIAEFMGNSQDLFVPLGFDAASATELSKTITGLSIDLASFNNKADADVLRDLHAALTGSGEVMKKYGVIVSEAAVKQELLNMGLDPATVTEREKVQARLNIILRGTTAAQGDAERSSDAFANQMKRLEGEIENAAGIIGGALLPAAAEYVGQVAEVVQAVAEWVSLNQELVVIGAKVVAVVGGMGFGLIALGGTISAVGSALGVAVNAVRAFNAACLFFALNPIVPAIIAVAVAAGGAALAIHELTTHTAKLTEAQEKLREAGDKQRATDQLTMERLQQLHQQQSRSNEETQEARDLIDQLQKRYGDLGLSIDEATGRIVGMTEAQQRLNAAMRDAAVAEVEAELSEVRNNIEELTKQMDGQADWEEWTGGRFGTTEALEKSFRQLMVLEKKRDALKKRHAALGMGDEDALTGGAKPDDLAERVADENAKREREKLELRQKAEDATKRLAELDEDAAAKKRDALDSELKAIQDITAERLRLLDVLIAEEKLRDPESKQIEVLERNKKQAIEAGRIDEEAAMQRHEDEKIKADEEEWARKTAAERALSDEIARMEIDADKKLSAEQKSQKKRQLDRERALEDAKEQGLDPALINRQHDLINQLAKQAEPAEPTQSRIFGTYSAAALAAHSQGGGKDPAKDMVEKQKEGNDLQAENKLLLADILLELRQGGALA
jgi:hypothetical protein